MFLQIVSLSRDIRNGSLSRAKLDSTHFAHGRVGFLGFGGVDLAADGFLLIAVLEKRSGRDLGFAFAAASSDCQT